MRKVGGRMPDFQLRNRTNVRDDGRNHWLGNDGCWYMLHAKTRALVRLAAIWRIVLIGRRIRFRQLVIRGRNVTMFRARQCKPSIGCLCRDVHRSAMSLHPSSTGCEARLAQDQACREKHPQQDVETGRHVGKSSSGRSAGSKPLLAAVSVGVIPTIGWLWIKVRRRCGHTNSEELKICQSVVRILPRRPPLLELPVVYGPVQLEQFQAEPTTD